MAQALAQADKTFADAQAELNRLWQLSLAQAQYQFALQLAPAETDLWQDQAEAAQDLASAEAAAYRQLLQQVGAAGVEFVQEIAPALSDWANTVSAARSAAFGALYPEHPGAGVVAAAWRAYQQAVTLATIEALQAEAESYADYLHTLGEAEVQLAQSTAAADLTWVQQIAPDYENASKQAAQAEKQAAEQLAQAELQAAQKANQALLEHAKQQAAIWRQYAHQAAQALAQAQEQTAQAVYQFTTQAITRQTEAVRQWLQTVEQAAREEQTTVFEQARQAVRELFQHWVQQAKNWQQLAKDQIQQLNQQVVRAAEDYAQYLVQQAKEHVAAVEAAPEADFASVMPEGLGGQLLKWADLLWQDAAALWERFRGWVAEHWNGFTGAIQSTWLWQEWVAPTFQGFGVWWNEYVQPVLDKVRSWGTAILDGIQIGLDILGLIPGLGNIFDGLNVLISLARGNYVDAMLSLAAMLPGAGIGAGLGKLAKRFGSLGKLVAKHSDEVASALARYGDEAAGAGKGLDGASREIAELLTAGKKVAVSSPRELHIGFGARGFYVPPSGTHDALVRARYLEEAGSLSFRIKLAIHNALTPFHRKITVEEIKQVLSTSLFGEGPFTITKVNGTFWLGGRRHRTFWNRQFFHHELIHMSQMLKNPHLVTSFPGRLIHEPIQLLTAHAEITYPTAGIVTLYIIFYGSGE